MCIAAASARMRILHLGNLQVVPALRALGHDVRVASELAPERVVAGRPLDVVALQRDVAPDADVFLMVDTLGRQTLAHGVEHLPMPRLYWAIDVHLNFFWQRHYARLFDLVLVAQQDWIARFIDDGVPARWLPWGIDPDIFRDDGCARTIDVAFVGVVDEHRPKRASAIAELRRRFDLRTFGADAAARLGERDMARVFGAAKIVFNESVLGDVNFRTFEAMACGALLVTERTGNGLTDLFAPGTHLAVYEPDDLVATVAHYLAADGERERIALAGARAVAERHTMAARMATLDRWIRDGVARRETTHGAAAAIGVTAHLLIARGLSDASATMRLAAERLRAATVAGGEVEAALAFAELMASLGRDDGALTVLAEARSGCRDDPRPWLLAGEIERRRGRSAAARTLFAGGIVAAALPAAIAADTFAALEDLDSAEVNFALGVVLQAAGHVFVPGFVRHLHTGLPRTAVEYFIRSLEAVSDEPRVLAHMSAVLELAGRHEFARPLRERLVRRRPADPAARVDWARVLHQSYELTAAAHQRRVAAALAGEADVDGTEKERAAARREAALARVDAYDAPGRGDARDALAALRELVTDTAPRPTLSLRATRGLVAPSEGFF
jgi:glycosyltransferase involved in cell wall biosynthesis